MESQGKSVPEDLPKPESEAAKAKKAAAAAASQTKVPSLVMPTIVINKSSKNYLQHVGKVLRFFCVWDDKLPHGRLHKLVLHYYLADDTIEVLEYQSNLHNTTPFVRRQKIPKILPSLTVDGSNLGKDDADLNLYKWNELTIGGTVKVFGKVLYLTGCDEFTRSFYLNEGKRTLPKGIYISISQAF